MAGSARGMAGSARAMAGHVRGMAGSARPHSGTRPQRVETYGNTRCRGNVYPVFLFAPVLDKREARTCFGISSTHNLGSQPYRDARTRSSASSAAR